MAYLVWFGWIISETIDSFMNKSTKTLYLLIPSDCSTGAFWMEDRLFLKWALDWLIVAISFLFVPVHPVPQVIFS
ncbi:hypothetical protein J7E79_14215 [Bacillus sp. ISL-40]|uniref:hypothetical protein n=1 Tax=unclassified Bacillus (in: firmicutes) TaxID=185979 RepID=UPI001BE6EDD9|nr:MULTISPECIES: hypothetical protein [unclassified Bacillus (in: firmicutes)]MBT2698564.1 hypothetical protein [Bacillus sp. ISL-40]MBT2720197.1 hypothetical protein [Bacillus sp. ISL-46]MBT2728597.1 hypothetical protein [Bacillus sp. ISL-75]MBT2739210.1 hypothetical protein [Bacillus sp. ISL-77]